MTRNPKLMFFSCLSIFELHIGRLEAEGSKRLRVDSFHQDTTALLETAHQAAICAILVFVIRRRDLDHAGASQRRRLWRVNAEIEGLE